MMKVIIRADASVAIGSGHVMRCLTIAKLLCSRKCQVSFFMRVLPGDLIEYVKSQGFPVIQEMQTADICIVDHYGLDKEWERLIRPFVQKIVVLDDLANRRHDCDLLMDPNFVPKYQERYKNLVPAHCLQLLGPNYLIMREEFFLERRKSTSRNGAVQQLLVFMGGSDPTNETMKVLNALKTSSVSLRHVDVVVGASNIHRAVVEESCHQEGYQFHCQIDYMAKLMGRADFSIGAGGSTTWERCYVGLPSASTIVAENQMVATETAAEAGAVLNLGWHEHVTEHTYKELIYSLSCRQEELLQMSQTGFDLTKTEKPNLWLETIMELVKS